MYVQCPRRRPRKFDNFRSIPTSLSGFIRATIDSRPRYNYGSLDLPIKFRLPVVEISRVRIIVARVSIASYISWKVPNRTKVLGVWSDVRGTPRTTVLKMLYGNFYKTPKPRTTFTKITASAECSTEYKRRCIGWSTGNNCVERPTVINITYVKYAAGKNVRTWMPPINILKRFVNQKSRSINIRSALVTIYHVLRHRQYSALVVYGRPLC